MGGPKQNSKRLLNFQLGHKSHLLVLKTPFSPQNLYTRTLGIHNKKTRIFSGKSPTVFVLTLTIDSKHTHVDDQAKILPICINCVPQTKFQILLGLLPKQLAL